MTRPLCYPIDEKVPMGGMTCVQPWRNGAFKFVWDESDDQVPMQSVFFRTSQHLQYDTIREVRT